MHFTLEFPETGVARPSCHQDNQKRKIAGFAEVVAQATIACPERQRAWARFGILLCMGLFSRFCA
jgi:hypothetical protein